MGLARHCVGGVSGLRAQQRLVRAGGAWWPPENAWCQHARPVLKHQPHTTHGTAPRCTAALSLQTRAPVPSTPGAAAVQIISSCTSDDPCSLLRRPGTTDQERAPSSPSIGRRRGDHRARAGRTHTRIRAGPNGLGATGLAGACKDGVNGLARCFSRCLCCFLSAAHSFQQSDCQLTANCTLVYVSGCSAQQSTPGIALAHALLYYSYVLCLIA